MKSRVIIGLEEDKIFVALFVRSGGSIIWAVAVAQLTVCSLPVPEDPGSNPVIGNFY